MKISISNIAWRKEKNEEIYKYLCMRNVDGIEIAPTKFVGENPYDKIFIARNIAKNIKEKYNLDISSIQSIWFKNTQNIFVKDEVKQLIEYTKKAIDFTSSINCSNIVFGCPKNRNNLENKNIDSVRKFFEQINDYAIEKNVYFSIEPNPVIYGTNFINTTQQAIELVRNLNYANIKVNIDFGTIIYNMENFTHIENNLELINHIHISEPNLEIIKKRKEHIELSKILKQKKYDKYVSIEMKEVLEVEDVKRIIDYVCEVFR